MELDKYEIKISKEVITAYAWKFSEIVHEKFMNYPNEQILKLKSDYNLGIDKAHRKFFLEKLEYLTRDDCNSFLTIELTPVSDKTPRHLDDPDEFVKHGKISFSTLEIRRLKSGVSTVFPKGNTLVLNFNDKSMFELFTKLYVNFEIYATEYDVKIESLDTLDSEKSDLIIWGVYGKDLVYY